MKNKKIAGIITVLIMMASMSACSTATGQTEGKSGIVRDEKSKSGSDSNTIVDESPTTFTQDAEYVEADDIISIDETVTIDGISYKIDSYEYTTEFGNRNKENVEDYLKDVYQGGIDDDYNLSNGNSYMFITLTITNNTDQETEIFRNTGCFYVIKDDLQKIQGTRDVIYIDSKWTGGEASEVFHYKLKSGESVTSELGYIIRDSDLPKDYKALCYEIKSYGSESEIQKYFKLEI